MTSKQMAKGITLVMILFSLVALVSSSAGATAVETASNAVEVVEKTVVESGAAPDGPPFPRIYMMVHNNLPDGYTDPQQDEHTCSTPLETADSWDTLAALANIIEMKFEFGNQWKVDMDGDGDCDTNDGDIYVVPWLEDQSNALPANYWGVTIPHKQLAFGSGWYYHYDPPTPPTHWREQHTQEVNQCVDQWPLRDTAGNLSHWTAETHPMVGLNVLDHAVYSGASNVCGGELYGAWWSDWIEVPVLGPVSAWDGVRLDLPGNMHGQFAPEANMDLDNCNDVRIINEDKDCSSAPTEYGNLTFNTTFRDGIQDMFAQLHSQHPDWLIFGNNAWWPEDGSAENPDPPGYASEINGTIRYPDINGTMVEDWTRNWWKSTSVPFNFSFSSWASPDPNEGTQKVDFARSLAIFKTWQDQGKMLVINGKWCNLPDEGVVGAGILENECGVDGVAGSNNGIVEGVELEPWRKSREVRFTMALATMLGEYHNYIGLETGFVPYWFDEYAVIPDPDGPFPFKAAATKEEKAAGVGWLGWPAEPTKDEMWAVRNNPNYGGNSYKEIYLGKSLSEALATTPPTSRNTYINDRAWIRYFDHGVVLINPTDSAKTVNLEGDYYRFLGRSAVYSPGSIWFDGKPNNVQDGTIHQYVVNNGTHVENSTVMIYPREGLFLVRNHVLKEFVVEDEIAFGQLTYTTVSISGEENQYWYSCAPGPTESDVFVTWRSGEGYACHDDGLLFGPWQPGHDDVSLLFNLSEIPSHAVIEDAKLEVYMDEGEQQRAAIVTAHVQQSITYWSPQEEHWISSPDISASIQSELLADGANPADIRILLYGTGGDEASNYFQFRSNNWGENQSYAPRLRIIYRETTGTGVIDDPTVIYQHGVDDYWGGSDTHIITTNWEDPTPHDTFPVIYLRTSGNEDEVFSSLVRFENLDLPFNAHITNAVLSLYYSGQSVNGGDVQVYASSTKPSWNPPQTTWATYQNNLEWLGYGARSVEDRTYYASVRTVNYTEVGEWLSFNVTSMMQEDFGEFILHASHLGVNKNIQLRSNDYWDASKRPKLMIWYEE